MQYIKDLTTTIIKEYMDMITIAILLIMGGIHMNPGPPKNNLKNQFQLITLNARGINHPIKRKNYINTCHEIFKENPATIIAVQETHFDQGDIRSMMFGAPGFQHVNSIYQGDGNKQKGVSTLFVSSYWKEHEVLHNTEGDMIITRFKNENLEIIVCNVYAPNNHDIQ